MNEKRLGPVIDRINSLLEIKERVVVGIDGMAASGKTTSAGELAALFGCDAVHMDDFFLPFSLRSPGRLAEAGGNIHYERFMEEAAAGIKSGEAFTYRVFDCKTGTYSRSRNISPSKLLVVEGAYCMHPFFGDLYDLKVFSAVEDDVQKKRILERDGAEVYKRFADLWIPMEKKYFEAFKIRRICDITI